MKINGIDTTKGGTINAMIERLYWMGYEVTKADTPNANFQCYNATITDKSGYNTITIFFGECDAAHITARVDKINGTHKWYYGKTLAQMVAVVRQCMEGYDWTKPTKAEEPENKEEEEIMNTATTANIGDKIKVHGVTYTIAEIHYAELFQSRFPAPDDGWMIEFTDTNGGYHYWKQYLDGGEFIKATAEDNTNTTNNEEEETTMKTTNVKINLSTGIVKFELNGITYTANPETKRYSKTVDGKTTRISYIEYNKAHFDLQQSALDSQPSRVEVNTDLHKPAKLDEFGLVDCSKCNVNGCVHRDCMRRNPKNVGGLGECPRLDNGIVSEAQKVAEDTGMELAEAELAVNVQNEQKKPRKARKSKDIAYEGHGKTLTAKQVDFILHLSDTCFWEHGLESTPWIDVLCDEIGGQFAGKPMTVGAMISTLCEKGLGYRATDSLTDMATGRSHKATYFALTDLGKEIAAELGLE